MYFLHFGYLHIITNLLMLVLAFAVFVIGVKHKNRHKEISHLYIYSFASFLQTLISTFFLRNRFFDFHSSQKIESVTVNIFVVIEFICIYFFFIKTSIITGVAKKALPFFMIIFLMVFLVQLLTIKNFLYNEASVYFLESCLVLPPCFIYIFQLFVNPPTLNLLNEASFWFNAGVLIYLTLTLPIFFMIDYFHSKSLAETVNIINYSGYCIVFSFLIRAYLCKPKTATI